MAAGLAVAGVVAAATALVTLYIAISGDRICEAGCGTESRLAVAGYGLGLVVVGTLLGGLAWLLLQLARGRWVILGSLGGRPLDRGWRTTALFAGVLTALVAAYAVLISWVVAAKLHENQPASWVDFVWVGIFGLPAWVITLGLLGSTVLFIWSGARRRVPRWLGSGANLMAALFGLWVLCVGTIVLAIAIETASTGY